MAPQPGHQPQVPSPRGGAASTPPLPSEHLGPLLNHKEPATFLQSSHSSVNEPAQWRSQVGALIFTSQLLPGLKIICSQRWILSPGLLLPATFPSPAPWWMCAEDHRRKFCTPHWASHQEIYPGLMRATSAHPDLANLSALKKKKKLHWKKCPILRQRWFFFHYCEIFSIKGYLSPFADCIPLCLLKIRSPMFPLSWR